MSWFKDTEKTGEFVSATPDAPFDAPYEEGEIVENTDHLHRRLGNRQIQLMAIGGTIGTALFVSIGGGLYKGGPGSLFLAYTIYACFLGLVNNCIAEMTIAYPVSGGFIRLAGHFVDDAFGFMAGYNFFIYEALLIPFEITALSTVLDFWSDDIPPWAIPLACIILYGILNVLAVKAFGEAEFWLSGGKVILIMIVFSFTFITMVGGNPQNDAYGFRNWKHNAFKEWRSTGTLGQFEGFCAALWSASFCVTGPEYISMVSAEARRPRVYIKNAFKTVYFRFALFFMGGAMAVGIVLSSTDATLTGIITGESSGSGTAAASPYVIAMKNMGIGGLPHLVSALLVTSIFSAGNTYTFCATRSLYGLAIEGRAPKALRYCTKSGVPLVCFAIVMIFPCLAFLQVSSGSNLVLGWLINLVTAGGVINYLVMCITYIFFYRACQAQALDRNTLPYKGWFQPYCAYLGAAWMIMIVFCYGYTAFAPWSVDSFFIYYTLLLLAPVTYFSWKLIKRTKIVKPLEADLVWERPTIDAYEQTFIDPPMTFWGEMLGPLKFGKMRNASDRQASVSQ
ncbi:putative amino acid permease [Aureobasidium pullulans]|uniref:Putative amino acid permease n=1 Tax=Aureobasidium pullulans TaxID=5580 RepID=A0A4S8SHY0_AURPU|nr:putative amino acid permease [Aureobasidium pullulans]THW69407.1 putative amino acid permease [Aureobasidium pullulans]THZ37041.1 putative amino acid permease [Aureobasidium pullulans]TIA12507.1 putative amino acid permease [Aureobasidium pullulans]